jgi:KDO2-lipid IV(A) lauroyltransferase
MATVSHQLEYIGAVVLARLAQLLSPRMADAMGSGMGSLVHALLASRRRIAFDNLKQALGDERTDDELSDITRDVFRNIGRTTVEIARFGVMKPSDIDDIVVEGDLDIFRRVLQEGKGAVCVTGHFGNWELTGSWLAIKGFPVTFGVGTQHNAKFDQYLNSLRKEYNFNIIELRTSLRQVFKALKSNRILVMASDQHAPSGVVIDFFGRKAATPKGPALFAIRTGSPIVPFLLRRERYDRHVATIGEPIYPPETGNEEDKIKSLTAAYSGFFEDVIRKYPDLWLWTHRRWKM